MLLPMLILSLSHSPSFPIPIPIPMPIPSWAHSCSYPVGPEAGAGIWYQGGADCQQFRCSITNTTYILCLQELIQQAALKRPALLKPLQQGVSTYLSAVTGAEGQGRLLVSKGQGVWEWGVDLPAAATLLQGLTLAADPDLPRGVHLIPASFKADLPNKYALLSLLGLLAAS